ncbi:MAG: SufD family Fe-S cluster assembly protein [Paludibacteraceae bacterium]|nr:SufD family Fe-S cluster assembly protein [Paludibacteraceae bacterium]
MLNLNKDEHKELVFFNEPDLSLHITQQEGSSLRIVVVDCSVAAADEPRSAAHTLEIHHAGTNCRTEIYVLAYLKRKDCVRTYTRMHHDIGGGVSKQVIKYVLADEAQGEFMGELKIMPNAQQVSAEQTNRNLLLSEHATMRTRPQLEIYADDVKAGHGATTGQLDESALFYMQQRGIDPTMARQMLVQAFMQDIMDAISDDTLRDAYCKRLTE